MKIEKYRFEGKKLEIHTYPDPVLAKKATPVEKFDKDLEILVKNMLYTMYQAPGIGLAAPQVGHSLRFFVVDVNYEREKITNSEGEEEHRYHDFEPMVFINPVITGHAESKILYEEGCLSLPGIYEEVERFERITVTYQDLKGNKLEIEADGLLAICLQHENDHLDGIVFIERLSRLKNNFYKKKLVKEKQLR